FCSTHVYALVDKLTVFCRACYHGARTYVPNISAGAMMRALSDRQQRMLQFIRQYMGEHGRPPTVREIGVAVGISSTQVVDYNLRVLERDGHLRRERELSRGIELADRGLP